MKTTLALAAALGVTLATAAFLQSCRGAAADTPVPTLSVEGGMISGVPGDSAGVAVYMGIPYAAPPVGDLRWKKPQPVTAWQGTRDCSQPGNIGPQPGSSHGSFYWKEFYQDGTPPQSEDCLYLNVWTAAPADTARRLPVMVWIHGGGLVNGYGTEIEFDGNALAKKDVVLVTFNYRLGMCGFLAHPLLNAENEGNGSGNYGFFDQLAALRWVNQNIAQFGGDPGNVTIFGQSAGAVSVQALVSSPLSHGLVHKAIIQSGGGYGGIMAPSSLEEAEEAGKAVWDASGITTLDQMRAYPVENFPQLMATCNAKVKLKAGAYSPCVDGEFLTGTYDQATQSGNSLDIPYMIGFTAQDIWPETMRKAATDWALIMEDQGRKPVFVYRFDRDLPGEDMPADPSQGVWGDMSGAFHSAELWYVFGSLGKCWRPMEKADYDLSRRMMEYWTNFARTGDPNGAALPAWQPYTSAQPHIQSLK